MSIIERINNSSDVKTLDENELVSLAEEIRQEMLSYVSETGGHVASNLGVVELTIALHRVFEIPIDKIIWDVGHQCYVHKMLTGRRNEMKTLRQFGGISGFPRRTESPADPFGAGHASTSISAALGMAAARDQLNQNHKVIAIIGDGALTGGLAFEGLNNAGAMKKDLIVILNDNNMSISKNVGALSKYLTNILVDQRFNKLRDEIWELTGRFKRRDKIRAMVSHVEDSFKGLFVPGYLFDKLGFRYFGPIDGHDIPLLTKTLNQMKDISGPLLLHVMTTKGKGYKPAENDATRFHGIGSFDKVTGKSNSKTGLPAYTSVFGDTMMELAAKDNRVVAITAAMTSGVGLSAYAEKYPDRFYDVGIAEGHASCFASGLASAGSRPYVAIYSTFLQRAYDQIIHDAALQRLPVVFCIDRAGLVGDDGPTHHGCFDLSYLSAIPDMTIMSPKDGDEFRSMLHATIDMDLKGPCAIRYPRANVPYEMNGETYPIEWGKWEYILDTGSTAVIAAGTMIDTALKTTEILDNDNRISIINARFIKPLDEEMLSSVMNRFDKIITIEENAYIGGLGQMVGSYLSTHDYRGHFASFAIPDKFIQHGTRDRLLDTIGLTPESMAEQIDGLGLEKPSFLKKLSLRKQGRNGLAAPIGMYDRNGMRKKALNE